MTYSNKFVLVGELAGQTINLGGHDFVEGVYNFVYLQEGIPTLPGVDDVKMKAIALERNYQAYPQGSAELEAAEQRYADLKAGKAPADEPAGTKDGTSKSLPHEAKDENDRSEALVTTRQEKTLAREALIKLDPKNDDHWTEAGEPAVAAVRAIAGIDTISRADIKALAPKLTRDEATKVAAGE